MTYAKGRRAEIRAKKELEADGWHVTRAAGSKGPFDLVAVKTRLIQVKACKEPHGWAGELEEMAAILPGTCRELWVWPDGGPWEKYEVSDELGE